MVKQEPKGYHIYFTDDVPEDVFVDEVEAELPVGDDLKPGNPDSWGPHPPFCKPSDNEDAEEAEQDEDRTAKKSGGKNESDDAGIDADGTQEVAADEGDEAEGEDDEPPKKGKKGKKKKPKAKPEEGEKKSLFARLFTRKKA